MLRWADADGIVVAETGKNGSSACRKYSRKTHIAFDRDTAGNAVTRPGMRRYAQPQSGIALHIALTTGHYVARPVHRCTAALHTDAIRYSTVRSLAPLSEALASPVSPVAYLQIWKVPGGTFQVYVFKSVRIKHNFQTRYESPRATNVVFVGDVVVRF